MRPLCFLSIVVAICAKAVFGFDVPHLKTGRVLAQIPGIRMPMLLGAGNVNKCGALGSLGSSSISGSGNNISLAASGNIAAGDFVLGVGGDSGSGTPTGASDTTNTYSLGPTEFLGGGQTSGIVYLASASAIVTPTITISISGAGVANRAIAAIHCPAATFGATDVNSNSAGGTSTSPSVTTSGTLGTFPNYVFATTYYLGNPTFTEASGWTQLVNSGGANGGAVDIAYQLVTSGTSVTYNPTLGSSQIWNALIMANH